MTERYQRTIPKRCLNPRCGRPFLTAFERTKYCSPACIRQGRYEGKNKPRLTFDQWLARVDTSNPNACHLWPGPASEHGYGVAPRTQEGKRPYVHKVLWERWNGPAPHGYEPDHTCRERLCTRRDHIELVTSAENKRRAVATRKASKRRLGPCVHGDEDVYVDPTGKRVCRICRRVRVRQWRAEQEYTKAG